MKTLGDIIGHERALGTLAAAARSGRVHHAWIFHGPEGVGKRTCSEAFALGLLGKELLGSDEDEQRGRPQP